MLITIPAAVCILGGLIYLATSDRNAPVAELARNAYWCGLLVTLFSAVGMHI